MFDFTTALRDLQEKPLMFPLLSSYMNVMNIKRYEHMPFYFYPSGQKLVSFEDGVIKFLDHLTDAHELERNKEDANQSFYNRANYVALNFHRYSNDTMANLTFDTKLRKIEYDRLNSVVDQRTKLFYLSATLTHLTALSYSAYFFRYRSLNKAQVILVGTAAYFGFTNINSIQYKTIVDMPVIAEARKMGLTQHIQPNGTTKVRGLNYC